MYSFGYQLFRDSQVIVLLLLRMLASRASSSFFLTTTKSRFSLQQQLQQVRHYIKEEKTPNPSAIKFLFPEVVLPESSGTGLFYEKSKKPTARELARSPLAKKLLDCHGVQSVFLGRDFVTITKDKDSRWQTVKQELHAHFFAFELGDLKAIVDTNQDNGEELEALHNDTKILETDSEIVAAVKELIESRVRPSVQEDGGDIFFVDFIPTTGIVQVSKVTCNLRI